MNKNTKQAFFSALLVWAVAFPVLGLKLSIDGINLIVHSQGPFTITVIAVCSVLMFLRVLFDKQWSAVTARGSDRKLISPAVSNFLTLPKTQRWIILGLIVVALVCSTWVMSAFTQWVPTVTPCCRTTTG